MASIQLQIAYNGGDQFRASCGQGVDLRGFKISWFGHNREIVAKVSATREGVLSITDRPHTARSDNWPIPVSQVSLTLKEFRQIEITALLTTWVPHGPESFRARGKSVKVQYPRPKDVNSVVCLRICLEGGVFKGTWEGSLPSDPPNSPLRPMPSEDLPPFPDPSLLNLLNPKYIAALVEDVRKSQELDRFPVLALQQQLKIRGKQFRACIDLLSGQVVSDQKGSTPQLQKWDQLRSQIYHLVIAIRKKKGNIPSTARKNIQAGIQGFGQLSLGAKKRTSSVGGAASSASSRESHV